MVLLFFFRLNNNMISFKEFFLEFHNLTNPHHRRRSITRGQTLSRNGETLENPNMVADKYKPTSPNHKEKIQTGPISNQEAVELISKHNIKNLPANLGKRPFRLIKTSTGYSIEKTN